MLNIASVLYKIVISRHCAAVRCSVAVAKKADRTAYDIRYSCRVQKQTAENAAENHRHVTTLSMAIPDAEISAVRFFAVCCG